MITQVADGKFTVRLVGRVSTLDAQVTKRGKSLQVAKAQLSQEGVVLTRLSVSEDGTLVPKASDLHESVLADLEKLNEQFGKRLGWIRVEVGIEKRGRGRPALINREAETAAA